MYDANRPWEQRLYLQAIDAPTAGPLDGPLVCLQVNASWLPAVLGAMSALALPAQWSGDDAAQQAAVTAATELLLNWGAAEECMATTWRFNDACTLQYSNDGGDTWTDVDGWPTNAPGCYTGATGATGETGPAGPAPTFRMSGCDLQYSIDAGDTWTTVDGWAGFPNDCVTPPSPPTVDGQSTADRACAIAAYLASQGIQLSLSSAVDSYNNAKSTLQAITDLSDLLVFWQPEIPGILNAAAGLYALYTSTSISNLTAASTDATLLHDLECAIYLAIVLDGEVTDANYADVFTAISAVSYPSTDAHDAIVGYIDALGARGLEALQMAGPYAGGDCSSCGLWCYRWDLSAALAPWALPYSSGSDGHWVSGTGVVGDQDTSGVNPNSEVDVWYNPFTPTVLTNVTVEFDRTAVGSSAGSWVQVHRAAGWTTYNLGTASGSGQSETLAIGGLAADAVYVRVSQASNTHSAPVVKAITLRGPGSGDNPFGANNCS